MKSVGAILIGALSIIAVITADKALGLSTKALGFIGVTPK